MKTSKTTLIDAPAKIVFLWLEDNERLKQWVPNLIEDVPIIEMPDKIGSTFRQVFLERGKRMEMTGEITAHTENERMRVFMTGDMFNLDVDYTLRAISPEQTDVTQDTEIKMKGAAKLFAPLMLIMSKFSRSDPQAEAHARLKALAEAEYQTSK
ncbi:SRPBCC family protein [Hellea balneolensis]|uniref:hypothetical protein n=1 Tax=Hellea balneolensis TaxID=287478 RepID=UPI000413F67A|nr:hypothetical protein [Hellea balneolensis]